MARSGAGVARRMAVIAASGITSAALVAGGILATSPSAAASGRHKQALKPFHVAIVPIMATEPLFLAKQRGYFKRAGLNVKITPVDSGPTLLTDVIKGTYQAGFIALFPALIAASHGANLKMVMSAYPIAPPKGVKSGVYGKQSALIVKKGSTIKNYRDLAGKTVATNALTSLTTLATKVGIGRQGGNPNAMKVIGVPFNVAIQEVARGQADAAVVVAPFSTLAKLKGLKTIGEPIDNLMPAGAPASIYVTSSATAKHDSSEVKAFRSAVVRAEKVLDSHPNLERELAHTQLGYSEKLASLVPLPYLSPNFSLSATQKYANLVAKYGYTAKPVNAKVFPG